MKVDEIRDGVHALWDSVTDGWERLRRSAAGALTRFRPGEASNLPERGDIDDAAFGPGQGWAMLGGDVFEDDRRVVVRIEAPGLEKSDFDVQVDGDVLRVTGEKRFEREATEGRWRVLQCAYGRFERRVPLPAPVRGDKAQASYRNGVLKVELPKTTPARPRRVNVEIV